MALTAEEIERLKNKHRTDISALNALVQLINENPTLLSIASLLNSNIGIQVDFNLLRVTDIGSLTGIVFSFSVYNAGAANGIVRGEVIKPGETFNVDAGGINNWYAGSSITYDATGTELVFLVNENI